MEQKGLEKELAQTVRKLKDLGTAYVRLETKHRDLKEKHSRLIYSFKSYSRDRWYIAYLQVECMRLEQQYDQLQNNFHDLLKDNEVKTQLTKHFLA